MAHHDHSQYPHGRVGGGSRSWGRGMGSSNSAHGHYDLSKREDDTIRCTHCCNWHPRRQFFRSVLAKYDKKLSRLPVGGHPTQIHVACIRCCNQPRNGISTDRNNADRHGGSPTLSQRRGTCNGCDRDYPLTTEYFLKGDTRNNAAHRRRCFRCRRDEQLDDEGYDVDGSSDGEIRVQESDDDQDERMPIRRIEEEPISVQQSVREARSDYANLVTKLLSHRSLAQRRRLRTRIVSSRELIFEQKRLACRQQFDSIANMDRYQQAEREYSLRKDYDLTSEAFMLHPDATKTLAFFEKFDLVLLSTTKQDDEFKNDLAGIGSVMPELEVDELADDKDDESDVPNWHLSDTARRDRCERQAEFELDRQDAEVSLDHQAPATIPRARVDRAVTSDILRHYQERVVAVEADITEDARPLPFDMAYVLSALESSIRLSSGSTSATDSASTWTASSVSDHTHRVADQLPSKRVRIVSEYRTE